MSSKFTEDYFKQAHTHTMFNETEARQSSVCTCFYCGYQFAPHTAKQEDVWEEAEDKDNTLACPMCGIDAVIGDASGFPVTDPEFIQGCTEYFFDGYSRISSGMKPEKVQWIGIEVE